MASTLPPGELLALTDLITPTQGIASRRSKAHSERTIGIETMDKLTDPQIVAKVREHFGIAR